MSLDGEKQYLEDVRRLQKEYTDEMKIFCGIEFDMYSDTDLSQYDYVIGAVHYLKIGDQL